MKIFINQYNSIPDPWALVGKALSNRQMRRIKDENRVIIQPMALSCCQAALIDSDGVDHSIEVEAESLCEAVAVAVAEFRAGEIKIDAPP